jgi:hypothetical protein
MASAEYDLLHRREAAALLLAYLLHQLKGCHA